MLLRGKKHKQTGWLAKLSKRTLLFTAAAIMASSSLYGPFTSAQSGSGLMGAGEEARQKAEFFDSSCADPASSDTSSGKLGKVYVLGDSITLGASDVYKEKMKAAGATEVKVSASGGGNLANAGSTGTKKSGLDAIRDDSDYIKGADTIVVAHGTNNYSHAAGNDISQMKSVINQAVSAISDTGTSGKVYWVDVAITDEGPPYSVSTVANINKALYESSSGNYSIVSWAKEVDPDYNPANATGPVKRNDEYIIKGDGIHLTPTGMDVLVDTVIESVGSGGGGSSSGGGSSGSSPGSGGLAGEEGTEGTFRTNGATNRLEQIIVHTTEGSTADAAITTLQSRGYAYHVLIEEDGNEIRLVEDEMNINGAAGGNAKSLHASLVGFAEDETRDEPWDADSPQLQTLSKRIAAWADKHDIPIEKIEDPDTRDASDTRGVAGHRDIGANTGKLDPGTNFPWDEVLANAGGSSTPANNDVCCVEGSGSIQLAGSDNEQKILNFFMEKGLSLAAAAGFVGNMYQESGLKPDIEQGGRIVDENYTPKNGVGFGLVQWTFTSRQAPLMEYTRSQGVPITDLGGQLGFIWEELNDGYKSTLEKLQETDDPVDAAIIVHGATGKTVNHPDFARLGLVIGEGYEASADSAQHVIDIRGGHAQEVYDKYKGNLPGGGGSSGGADCGDDSGGGNGILEAALEMGEWGEAHSACYVFGAGHGGDQADMERRIENKFHGPENAVDCSAFTTAVILRGTGVWYPGDTNSYCADTENFDKIPRADAKPGDFSIDCGAHIEVITKVNGPNDFETVGSHSAGCGPGKGASPGTYAGTESFVLRWKGGGTS